MKKTILAALLLAAPALATDWTVTTVAAQETRFDRDRLEINAATCTELGLAPTCTQGQAKAAFCAKPGSSGPTPPCTVNGVSSNSLAYYTTIGLYLDRYVIDTYDRDLKERQRAADIAKIQDIIINGSAATKDAICVAAGLPAGCLPAGPSGNRPVMDGK